MPLSVVRAMLIGTVACVVYAQYHTEIDRAVNDVKALMTGEDAKRIGTKCIVFAKKMLLGIKTVSTSESAMFLQSV
jgi:hypothetical protein